MLHYNFVIFLEILNKWNLKTAPKEPIQTILA